MVSAMHSMTQAEIAGLLTFGTIFFTIVTVVALCLQR